MSVPLSDSDGEMPPPPCLLHRQTTDVVHKKKKNGAVADAADRIRSDLPRVLGVTGAPLGSASNEGDEVGVGYIGMQRDVSLGSQDGFAFTTAAHPRHNASAVNPCAPVVDAAANSDSDSSDLPETSISLERMATTKCAHGPRPPASSSEQTGNALARRSAGQSSEQKTLGGDAQSSTTYFPRLLHSLRRVGGPMPSPDGRFVAFTVRELASNPYGVYKGPMCEAIGARTAQVAPRGTAPTSQSTQQASSSSSESGPQTDAAATELPENKAFVTRIYLWTRSTQQVRRLTDPGTGADVSPSWLTARHLVFLSSRGGAGMNVWCVDVTGQDGCAPVQVTKYPAELSVSDLKVCSDRQLLLFSVNTLPTVVWAADAEHKSTPLPVNASLLHVRAGDDWMAAAAGRLKAQKARHQHVRAWDNLPTRDWDRWVSPAVQKHVCAQMVTRAQDKGGLWCVQPSGPPVDLMASYAPVPYSGKVRVTRVNELSSVISTVSQEGTHVHYLDTSCPFGTWGDASHFDAPSDGSVVALSLRVNHGDNPSQQAWTTNTHIVTRQLRYVEGALVPAATFRVVSDTRNNGYQSNPLYSPSGASLCWLGMDQGQYEASRKHIHVVTTDQDGRSVSLRSEVFTPADVSTHGVVWASETALVGAADFLGRHSVFTFHVTDQAVVLGALVQLNGFNYAVNVLPPLQNDTSGSAGNGGGGVELVFAQSSFARPADLFRWTPASDDWLRVPDHQRTSEERKDDAGGGCVVLKPSTALQAEYGVWRSLNGASKPAACLVRTHVQCRCRETAPAHHTAGGIQVAVAPTLQCEASGLATVKGTLSAITAVNAHHNRVLSQLPKPVDVWVRPHAASATDPREQEQKSGCWVQSWVMLPTVSNSQTQDTSGNAPVAVLVHGGPQGAFGDSWHYRWNPQCFLAQGYAVITPNFHGSTGLGQTYTDCIQGNWGGTPARDVWLAVKGLLLSHGDRVDGSRLYAVGASYGGFMVNWLHGMQGATVAGMVESKQEDNGGGGGGNGGGTGVRSDNATDGPSGNPDPLQAAQYSFPVHKELARPRPSAGLVRPRSQVPAPAPHGVRFRAFVCHDGLFHQEAMYYTTEEVFFVEWEQVGVPWWRQAGQENQYDRYSPHRYAPLWCAPTLVIHGGLDYRIPETQGLMAFQMLRRLGVPGRLVLFPTENHFVCHPSRSIEWHKEVLGFMDTHQS